MHVVRFAGLGMSDRRSEYGVRVSSCQTGVASTVCRSLLSKPAPLCRIAGLLYADREVLNVEVGHVSETHNYELYELVCGS